MEEQTDRDKEERIDYEYYQDYYDCHMCHKAPIDRSESSNSLLCRECREKAIRYPIPKRLWAAAAVIIVLMAISMVRFPQAFSSFKVVKEAEERILEGELYETMDEFLAVVEQYPQATSPAGDLVKLAMKYGCYNHAAYTIDTFLVGQEVNDNLYYDLNQAVDTLDRFYQSIDTVQSLAEDVDPQWSADEVSEFLRDECIALVDDKEHDPALLYYYASMFTIEPAQQSDYLKKALELNPVLWDAYVSLGTLERRANRLMDARVLYEKVLTIDRHNTAALRAMGILNMLEGNEEQGRKEAELAYTLNPDTMYVRETYMIAMALYGDRDKSEEIRQEIIASGEILEEDTEKLLAGEITLQDYYIGE